MVEYIKKNGQTLSVIIKAAYQKEGIEFFTPGDFSQQLGYMNRKQGYEIPPHKHNLVERKVTLTQEVLYIKSPQKKAASLVIVWSAFFIINF